MTVYEYRVCFRGNENVTVDSGDGCTTSRYTENPLIVHFKTVNFMACGSYYKIYSFKILACFLPSADLKNKCSSYTIKQFL